MSPDQPSTRQISPEASALRYSDEWNLRTTGRILVSRSAAFSRSACCLGVRIEAEIVQRRRQDVVGGIEHVHAAVLELGEHLRLEHDVPAVDRCSIGRRATLARLLDVVADAGRAPHVIDGVLVAGIVDREPLRDLGPDIAEIRQLALVELLEHAGLDLALEEIGGRHHHVVAGLAGEQLGLQHLVGVERVVADLDAGLLGEVLEHRRLDVVRPVVDVDGARSGPRPAARRPAREPTSSSDRTAAEQPVRDASTFSFRSAGRRLPGRGCRRPDARRRAGRAPARPATRSPSGGRSGRRTPPACPADREFAHGSKLDSGTITASG